MNHKDSAGNEVSKQYLAQLSLELACILASGRGNADNGTRYVLVDSK